MSENSILIKVLKLEEFRKKNPKTQFMCSLTLEGRSTLNMLLDRFKKLVGPDGGKMNASLIVELLIKTCFSNFSGLGGSLKEIYDIEKAEAEK